MSEDLFKIELTAMAHGGSALGRHQKQIVFIPYTIPGEIVEARITEERGRVAFAEGVKLVDASADRVFPRCPHFGPSRCGRCQWQHIDTPAQLLLKQDVLADQLARIGGYDDADVRPVVPSPEQWGYNYHMDFLIKHGVLGLPGATEGTVMPIEECHILHPELLLLFEQLELDFSGAKQLRLQKGTTGEPLLVLWVDAEDDAPELQADMRASINLMLPDDEPVNLIGASHVVYEINGREFRATAGSAFRANIAGIDPLAAHVLDALDLNADASVLDLYAGVGVFSAYIAPRAALVTLVESFAPAVTDADENLSDFENIDIVEGTVEDVLPELGEAYDAAVLDPPADGLSTDVMDILGARAIPRLVYVSGDPAILARDAKRLAGHGYTLAYVQPFDLNPHTYNIDAVALFTHHGG